MAFITTIRLFGCLRLTFSFALFNNEGEHCHNSCDSAALLQGRVAVESRTLQVRGSGKWKYNADNMKQEKVDVNGIATQLRTEPNIWSVEAPLLTGSIIQQTEFCKMHPKATWDKKRMKASIELVRTITTAFRTAGIPPMIMDGTLLSFIRQGFLINGDHDLDFWIPRRFMNTPKQWDAFVQAMADQDIHCLSSFRQYAAGWKIACFPLSVGGHKGVGWKLDNTDSHSFYVDVSVVDEGTAEGLAPPGSWISYLTVHNKTYPGFAAPFNWRLASWHNVTLWVPSDPEKFLIELYTPKWKEPVGGSGDYNHWKHNTPIPKGDELSYLSHLESYFKSAKDQGAADILMLQERLEMANAKHIAEDASKQWILAVDFCAALNKGSEFSGDDSSSHPMKMQADAGPHSADAEAGQPMFDAGLYRIFSVELGLASVACWVIFSAWCSATSRPAGFLGFTTFLQVYIFAGYICLSVGHMFLQQRAGASGYSIISATVMINVGKFTVSFLMFLYKGNHSAGFSTLVAPGCSRFGKLPACTLPLITGGLLAGYDALSFFSLAHLDPTTYQIFVHTRVICIGCLWQFVFRRKLSATQWLAFGLFTAAGITKSLDRAQLQEIGFHKAIGIVILQIAMSAFANISSEVLLKEMTMPTDLLNACMYFWGLVWLVIALLCTRGPGALYSELLSPVAWSKLHADPWMIGAICCMTAFGITTAYLLKELSNIVKELSGCIVMIFSTILSWHLFGNSVISARCLLGISMAVLGVGVYSTDPLRNTCKDETTSILRGKL